MREKVAGRGLRPFATERGIPYSTLRYYCDEQLPPLTAMPRPETLRHLAEGLRLPLDQVRRAALQSLEGSYDPDSTEPTTTSADAATPAAPLASVDLIEAIRRDPHLLPEAKEHLERQYGLLLRVQAAASASPVEVVAAEEDARSVVRAINRTKKDASTPRKTAAKRRT